jgi:hypothetical protein
MGGGGGEDWTQAASVNIASGKVVYVVRTTYNTTFFRKRISLTYKAQHLIQKTMHKK